MLKTRPQSQSPLTKDQALCHLGVASRTIRRTVTPYVDFELLESGRRLVNRLEHAGDVLIGVTGSVLVDGPGGLLSLNGDFVIDSWMLDPERRSVLEITTTSPVVLLRVNWQYRFVVFECIADLVACSEATRERVLGGCAERGSDGGESMKRTTA